MLVFLLALPILIYAIVSGILKEFKGPGGWEASFSSEATASVSDTLAYGQISADDENLQVLPPGETETRQGAIQDLTKRGRS